MAKRKTANQQAFARQRKRIMAALRREEKKGYNVEPLRQAIRAQFDNAPSRITKKMIQDLKNITPSSIRSLASQVVQDYTLPTVTEVPYIEDYGLPSTPTNYETKPIETHDIVHPEAPFSGEESYNKYVNDRYAKSLMDAIHNVHKPIEEETNKEIEGATDYLQSGNEYIIYDKDGNAIDKVVFNNGEYVSTETGTIYGTRGEFEDDVLNRLNEVSSGWADLSDYAIELLYDQTSAINSNTNGVFHQMFDAVRARVGDKAFYDSLTSTNGYRSAFETFSKMAAIGASYPQEFTRFGISVLNALPVTPQERADLEEAFANIIEAEYGAEIHE